MSRQAAGRSAETAQPAVQALREYADALRGDWGDFDGRSNKAVLDDLAAAIEGGNRADWTVAQRARDLPHQGRPLDPPLHAEPLRERGDPMVNSSPAATTPTDAEGA